jgi:hypothetical protein
MPREPGGEIGIPLTIRRPSACSSSERAAFLAVAEKSNEVERANLENGFSRARYVVWASDSNGLAGVCALKSPRRNYRRRVFVDSICNLACEAYPLEFGYLYVEVGRRNQGYGNSLVVATLNLAEGCGIFATTREANTEFHALLIRNGFRQVGQAYRSERNESWLFLFVRDGAPA